MQQDYQEVGLNPNWKVGFRLVPAAFVPPTEPVNRYVADATACELLRSHLNRQQLAEWENYRWFTVDLGPRTYRIAIDDPFTHTFNIVLTKGTIESGRCGLSTVPSCPYYVVGTAFCIVFHAQMFGNAWLPVYDRLLAQKLVLEHNEDHFLATAVTRPVVPESR